MPRKKAEDLVAKEAAAQAEPIADEAAKKEEAIEEPILDAPERPAEPLMDAAEAEAEEEAEEAPEAAPAPKKGKKDEPSAKDLARARKETNIDRKVRAQERAEKVGENQKFYAGISAMQEAQRRHRIMSGTIAAIDRVSAGGTRKEAQRDIVMLSVMVEGRFKVMIPFEEFFRDNPIDMTTVDLKSKEGRDDFNRRQRQMAEKMYGATIDFVVTHVEVNNPQDYSIGGSRRVALAMLEKRNFVSADGGKPFISVGDTRPAEIISVGQYNLVANVGGVDVSIPLRDMTYRYVTNLAKYYKVGDTIEVDIMEIRQRADGRVNLTVSAKSAELKDAKYRQASGLIKEGSITLGVITSIRPSRTKENKIVIHAYLPYFQMPAVVRAMDPKALIVAPQAGDELRLSVSGFSDAGFVLTSCHGFHNAASLLTR